MSENTFISILKANRLMRSDEEVTAFEKALLRRKGALEMLCVFAPLRETLIDHS